MALVKNQQLTPPPPHHYPLDMPPPPLLPLAANVALSYMQAGPKCKTMATTFFQLPGKMRCPYSAGSLELMWACLCLSRGE